MCEHDFVHLHVHTEFSLLDGLSKIDRLVNRAKELNMKALAITDHGAMFGVINFFRACKAAEIKPIIGMEAYMARRSMRDRDPKLDKRPYHMLLLARDMQGYKNLCKLASAAQLDGYYYRPRIDRDILEQHSAGLIATSGCLAAQIPTLIMEGKDEEAREQIGWYQEVFGPDNFYLELQQHDIPELKTLNQWLLDYRKSGHSSVPLVATNDVHYVMDKDYDPHDTLLCIQTGALKSDADRLRMSDASYHLTSQDEMARFFAAEAPEALSNTLKVAEMCDVNLDTKGYHLPVFPVPEPFEEGSYLRHLCEKGLRWRFGERASDSVLTARIDRELDIIHTMGFDTYFLIVWDLCQFARQADIWWNVRGSGAGSLVAYSLGITNIDPILNNLLFERFLNPGRVSMPDIDMDFPDDRRSDMIDYCARKYGEDKVAAIITFGTLGAKAAVRDVGRALNVPLELVNQAAKLIPTEPKPKPVKVYVEENAELKQMYNTNGDIRRIIDTAETLQGVSRHASTHAAGIIVADKPLVEYLPLHRPTKSEDESESPLKSVTQFPMETCEQIGLLKIDFLGLSTLTIFRKACELVTKHHNIQYTMDNLPYRPTGDPKTDQQLKESFEMIGRGETVGVFQVESTGMQQMLRDMRPTKFEHIVAAVSLYRPGPMDFIPLYNKRLRGEEETTYRHDLLEPILAETYGICISGDSLVIDARTGNRKRVDEVAANAGEMLIQGVDADYCSVIERVSHWQDNGIKPVHRLTLENGASIKATKDHQFLTETGWQRLDALKPGDYIATPTRLIEPSEPLCIPREKLRVLAYLIADGSLASYAAVEFVNKDQLLLDEYVRCLGVFKNVEPTYLTQIHDVTRVMTRNRYGKGTTELLAWLRELGLKNPPVDPKDKSRKGGCRSQEKFIPGFVFQLNDEDLAYFLASLWDCDGYLGEKMCHYKTISAQLAVDVQTLLLRLGISSTIYTNEYESVRGKRTSYQVTSFDAVRLKDQLAPHLVTIKRDVACCGDARSTISREPFIQEVEFVTGNMPSRQLMSRYGIDRQHFLPNGRKRERIAVNIVRDLASQLPLPQSEQLTRIIWQPIASIEPAGEERVYDLTVERIHNFVANNIIVHNCVYQEQIMQIAGQVFGYELGEADLMRRAVSKKKEKDLKKHREIFLERGSSRGLDEPTINHIFDDIEFFANYGFNKSHAADYAVITCQTAFLKCHYPHEYLTALLFVHSDDIAKITTFLGEARRLGIPILPPDVNYSALNFDIQKQPDGKRGIRFGLAAIKNAGETALQPIIDARESGGIFDSLEDFCRRVDLRLVGKRTLESLIKVGAMTAFGNRNQLLQSMDRLLSFSADDHRAKEIGQMSMFGGVAEGGIGGGIELPPLPELADRELLDGEKELLGLYISGRPADKVRHLLQHANTVDIAEAKAAGPAVNGRGGLVAGEVVTLRKIPTKNGDMMGIAHIEDWHDSAGAMDVVLFPRTWAKFGHLVQESSVLIASGKLDTSRGDLQLICEAVREHANIVMPDDPSSNLPPLNPNYLPDEAYWVADSAPFDEESGEVIKTEEVPEPVPTLAIAPATQGAAAIPTPALEPVGVATAVMPIANGRQPAPWHDDVTDSMAAMEEDDLMPDEERPAPPRWLMIYMKRSDDPDTDRRRLKRLHGILTSYPGQDRFSIVVEDKRSSFKMEFPNHTTSDCEELRRDLLAVVGEGNLEAFDNPDQPAAE